MRFHHPSLKIQFWIFRGIQFLGYRSDMDGYSFSNLSIPFSFSLSLFSLFLFCDLSLSFSMCRSRSLSLPLCICLSLCLSLYVILSLLLHCQSQKAGGGCVQYDVNPWTKWLANLIHYFLCLTSCFLVLMFHSCSRYLVHSSLFFISQTRRFNKYGTNL